LREKGLTKKGGRKMKKSIFVICFISLITTWVAYSFGADISEGLKPKEVELYSWQVGGQWRFSLFSITNYQLSEYIRTKDFIMTDFRALKGFEELKQKIRQIEPGTRIVWFNGGCRDCSGFSYPPNKAIEDLKDYCETLGIELIVGQKRKKVPIELAPSFKEFEMVSANIRKIKSWFTTEREIIEWFGPLSEPQAIITTDLPRDFRHRPFYDFMSKRRYPFPNANQKVFGYKFEWVRGELPMAYGKKIILLITLNKDTGVVERFDYEKSDFLKDRE
jgi:hypothetical protein